MRLDLKVTILIGLAGVPLGMAIMAAPLYFDISRQFAGIFFYGGLIIAVAILAAATIMAYRGETGAPVRGHRNRMIALIGMIVCGLGFLTFGAIYFWPESKSPISFEKFALYFVKWDDGIYRLGATGQLLNHENRLFVIDAINYRGGSWTLFPRGPQMIQRYTEFNDEPEIPDEAAYLPPTSEGYIKKLLKIRMFMTSADETVPNLLLRGKWELVIGKEIISLTPIRFYVEPKSISRQQWDALDPSSIKNVRAVAVPQRPLNAAPGSKEQPRYTWYLLYSPDRSATIDNPYFQETQAIKNASGVMVFAYANASVPLDLGWRVLGHTYHEAWSDPETLAIYNSIYPPDKNNKPHAFGYFAGNEEMMLGGESYTPAPVTRGGDIIEMQVPETKSN